MLSVRGLTKIYAGRHVVRDVWFDLRPTTVTVVLGREGAGRTTLLRLICGLIPATSGMATIGGTAFAGWPNPAHVAGVVLDPEVLHPGRTGRAHLRAAARLAGSPDRRIGEVAEMLGLESYLDRPVRTYDRALRLWLTLGHALLTDPPVLLLDEPLVGLNPEDDATIRTLLRTHADRGGTVLLTGGDVSDAHHCVDRALVLDEGRVAADRSIPDSDNAALAEALNLPAEWT